MTTSTSSQFQERLRRVGESSFGGLVRGLKSSPVVIAVALVILHAFVSIAPGRELSLSIQIAVFLFLVCVVGQTVLGGIDAWFDKSKPPVTLPTKPK